MRPFALSAVALLVSAPAAFALDANDFASKLTAVYGQSLSPSSSLKFGAATVSGDTITYDGITVALSGEAPFKLDTKLTFTGVKEQADGSYVADALNFPDVDYKFEGGEVTAKGIALKHIFVAGGKKPDVLDSTRLFGEATVGPVVVMADGKQVMTLDSATVTNSFAPSQTEGTLATIGSTGATSGLKVDLTQSSDPESVKQVEALGLSTVNAKVAESINWSLKDGHLSLSDISVDVDKVGKLKLALDMSGYTPEFLHNLGAVSQTLAQQGTSGDQSQQQTAMLLASLQTLFLNSTSLRFDDAAITGKALDMAAKDSNVTKAEFIDGIVASIPGDMNADNSMPQAMVQQIQAAVRAYLMDPHSIEIRLAPKTPLGVLGIVAAAMQPAAAADTLGLQILVNDKQITAADAAKETGVAPAASETAPSSNGDAGTATPDSGSNDNGAASDSNSDQSSDTGGDNGRLTSKHDH